MFKIQLNSNGNYVPVITCDQCKDDIPIISRAVVIFAARDWKYPAKTVHTGKCQESMMAEIATRNSCSVEWMPLTTYFNLLKAL